MRLAADALFSLLPGHRDTIIGSGADAIFGASASTGDVRWVRRARLMSVLPTVADGRVFAWLWETSSLLCLDEQDGSVVYDRRQPDGRQPIVMPGRNVWTRLADDYIVTTTGFGGLMVRKPPRGWRADLDAKCLP